MPSGLRVGSPSTGPGPPGTRHRVPTRCAHARQPGRNRPPAPIPGPIAPRSRRASTPLPRRDRPAAATSPHTVTLQRHLRRQRPLPPPAVPGTPTDRPPPRSARAPRATARSPPDRGSPPARAAGPRTAGRPARRCQTRAAAGLPKANAAGDCGDGRCGVVPAGAYGRGAPRAGDVLPQPLTSPASPRCPHPQPDRPHHRPHRGGSQRQAPTISKSRLRRESSSACLMAADESAGRSATVCSKATRPFRCRATTCTAPRVAPVALRIT